ncbi:hypothetical protein D3C71_2071400 [compost metagenome]
MLPRTPPSVSILEETTTSALAAAAVSVKAKAVPISSLVRRMEFSLEIQSGSLITE